MTTNTADRTEDRWLAVLAHDASRNGDFVYAVQSTGVYCRPGCPSRRPDRSRVSFYDSPAQAKEAGFRACKRCHPDTDTASDALVLRARQIIDATPESLTLDALAEAVETTPAHLQRVFKAAVGMTPRQYAAAARVARLRSALREQPHVTDALYDAGFGSSRALYESAGSVLGMTPAKVGRRGRGEQIRYGITGSPLGPMLVAATDRGICFIGWDEPEKLRSALGSDFAEATLIEDDAAMEPIAAGVRAVLDGADAGPLPLDIAGTPFQIAVWSALLSIPAGETRTYAEIAVELGLARGAARAVGRACALNRVALLVPCHRAVGHNGSLTGFRWGVERKRALLSLEQGAPVPATGESLS